ncbi:3-hydroxyacyl-CoA dehydrogenase type-2-like [Bradysia coprophila]|uniref:3-hydroxyacyl-CoA dehydrogenase type-2-like n=1 Tax=Bradysia coprophila TaxID=38358 RepID=UPI00187DA9C1|nr:3-hydroxyacyl-CoA dehydrogenase type-2-like [Bradysia coprophila]
MLKKAVALVTGGASGLGRATVNRLVRSGTKVVVCDLPTSAGHSIAENLGGDNVVFVPTDVTSEEDVTAALETTKSKFGRLDVCVNCAGTAIAFETYNFNKNRPHQVKDFADTIRVNAIGTFNVIRLSAGLIAENKPNSDGQRGVIITTSAYSAYDGQRGQAAYSAANAAIVGMTLPIAREFSSHGIRVVGIAPGLMDTLMCVSNMSEDFKDFLTETVVFPHRLGHPSEYAQLVETIVENPLLNGITIRLDGGFRGYDG